MDRHAADESPTLDNGCTFAEFSSLNGCFLPGRAAADDDKIILLHRSSLLSFCHYTEQCRMMRPRSCAVYSGVRLVQKYFNEFTPTTGTP
jgi:hypothetical protein